MQKTGFAFVMGVSLLLAGCAADQRIPSEDKALRTTAAWEVNHAVMTAAERSGNYEIALKTGEDELRAHPDNDEAKIIVSRLLTRTGQPQRAATLLGSIKDDPDGRVLIERVRSLIAMDMGSLARELIDEPEELAKIRGKDNQFEARKLLAVAMDLEGDNKRAQAQYTALLSEREDPAVRMNYGRSLIATRDYGLAADILMPLVDSQAYPQARILAAGALFKSGDSRLARNLLEGYLSDRKIEELMRK